MSTEDSDDAEPEVKNGLLSTADREYLRGEKSYDNPDSERRRRHLLRERLRLSFRTDFSLVASELNAKDRRLIFVNENRDSFQGYAPEETFRTNELGGAINALAFTYAALLECNADFEEYLAEAISLAHHRVLDSPWRFRDVEVDIDDKPQVEAEAAYGKLRSNETLTSLEYYSLIKHLHLETEEFLSQTEAVDLPIERTLENNETLSRGHSLIAYARGIRDPEWLETDIEREIIDDEVLTDLGIPRVFPREVSNPGEQDDEPSERSEEPTPEEVAEDL